MIDNQPSFVVIDNRCVSYSSVSAQSVGLFVLMLVVSIVGASAEPEPHPRKGLLIETGCQPLDPQEPNMARQELFIPLQAPAVKQV